METLIGKINGNLCSLQFYDQGTGKKDGSSSAGPSSLILPEKNFHYIKISPADSDSSKFLGFTKLTPLDKDSIERDIEGLIFDDGFKRIELDPGTVFDSVGVIIRKITFPSTLEYFESIKVQDEELKRSSGAGGNGKSLLDELDFSKCKNLSFNSNFLNYWKVKKVNLYGAGCSVSPIPVLGTGSINCLGFLKLLMLPERYEVMDSSFFNIDTVSGLGISGNTSTENYCTIIANTMIVNSAVLDSSKGSVFNCCNIDNFYIKSILDVQANPSKFSKFTLFRDCRIGSLYITEEIIDEFSKLNFRFDNTVVDRLYIFRDGFPKPPNWLNNFKQALKLSNLITEKFITDVTYDEAVKEIIEES
jgi:hypothetical protein